MIDTRLISIAAGHPVSVESEPDIRLRATRHVVRCGTCNRALAGPDRDIIVTDDFVEDTVNQQDAVTYALCAVARANPCSCGAK